MTSKTHGARTLRQHTARIENEQLVAPQEPPGLVHHPDAIGVAVEADPEVGVHRPHPRHQIDHVLLDGGVGDVVGEVAVRFDVEALDLAADRFQQADRDDPGRTVAAIDRDAQRPHQLHILGDVADVRVEDITTLALAASVVNLPP